MRLSTILGNYQRYPKNIGFIHLTLFLMSPDSPPSHPALQARAVVNKSCVETSGRYLLTTIIFRRWIGVNNVSSCPVARNWIFTQVLDVTRLIRISSTPTQDHGER
jgi:hypothetical protein